MGITKELLNTLSFMRENNTPKETILSYLEAYDHAQPTRFSGEDLLNLYKYSGIEPTPKEPTWHDLYPYMHTGVFSPLK